jgi:hypothetical protein
VTEALRAYRGCLVIINPLDKANAGVNSANRFGLLGKLLLARVSTEMRARSELSVGYPFGPNREADVA